MSTRCTSTSMEITAVGLCTPLGIQANTVPYTIDAGLVRFRETRELDVTGEPVRASRLALLDDEAPRTSRMATMAATALADCLAGGAALHLSQVPVILALPHPNDGAPYSPSEITDALGPVAEQAGLGTLAPAVLVQEGRAGFMRALELAAEKLRQVDVALVLVGAVDSLCDPITLDLLAACNRVQGDENRDGIIPGEGAGFVMLTASGDRTAYAQAGSQAATRVIAVATDIEAQPFSQPGSSQGLPGEALTRVFRSLCHEPVVMELRAERLLSCQSGERYFAEEFANAYLRNGPVFPEPLVTHSITHGLGDTGAAAGLIQVAYGAHLLIDAPLGHGSGRRALVYGSSDHGCVGACILEVFGAPKSTDA